MKSLQTIWRLLRRWSKIFAVLLVSGLLYLNSQGYISLERWFNQSSRRVTASHDLQMVIFIIALVVVLRMVWKRFIQSTQTQDIIAGSRQIVSENRQKIDGLNRRIYGKKPPIVHEDDERIHGVKILQKPNKKANCGTSDVSSQHVWHLLFRPAYVSNFDIDDPGKHTETDAFTHSWVKYVRKGKKRDGSQDLDCRKCTACGMIISAEDPEILDDLPISKPSTVTGAQNLPLDLKEESRYLAVQARKGARGLVKQIWYNLFTSRKDIES